MSEKILKALMELFALIVKQDGGIVEKERNYVLDFLKKQLSTNVLIRYLLLMKSIMFLKTTLLLSGIILRSSTSVKI
jgi:hypothetical protein